MRWSLREAEWLEDARSAKRQDIESWPRWRIQGGKGLLDPRFQTFVEEVEIPNPDYLSNTAMLAIPHLRELKTAMLDDVREVVFSFNKNHTFALKEPSLLRDSAENLEKARQSSKKLRATLAALLPRVHIHFEGENMTALWGLFLEAKNQERLRTTNPPEWWVRLNAATEHPLLKAFNKALPDKQLLTEAELRHLLEDTLPRLEVMLELAQVESRGAQGNPRIGRRAGNAAKAAVSRLLIIFEAALTEAVWRCPHIFVERARDYGMNPATTWGELTKKQHGRIRSGWRRAWTKNRSTFLQYALGTVAKHQISGKRIDNLTREVRGTVKPPPFPVVST